MVGFDLDLTLLDARAGIRATFAALSAETGVAVDGDAVVGRLGPPLETELASWFPAAQIPAQADRYRQLYAVHAIPASAPMPGAARAVAAAKGTALLEQHVDIFVGDHVGDMIGARAGGAHAVGLTTGPCSADELRAAGADTVLTHLDEFPA
ncbi:HAD hydrolase-like protein [Frankia sp. AgPm24]|uniref:HAD family hydrolase n=1 Tax=Frankia sp. AgPm24 TaxID=631128 RepID=UPI0027E3016E|nr:HAD hydrolase-like protein [Frankia sp. AgPm24]